MTCIAQPEILAKITLFVYLSDCLKMKKSVHAIVGFKQFYSRSPLTVVLKSICKF